MKKAILLAFPLLAACTPSMTDEPDLRRRAPKEWKLLAECTYSALIRSDAPGMFEPGVVDYAPLDSEGRAIITVGVGRALAREIRGDGQESVVTVWAHLTAPGITPYEDRAWAAVASCI